ncbi:MAG: DUF1294 domain-containing protein [Patescibacteria group bacterium]|nr:DUF1294 domain-containing protein [Patescibacteria group bacterium]
MQNLYILFFGALVVINSFAFVWVGVDKKKSLKPAAERLPEASFFFISVFFASLGVLTGMFFFRHKTRKIYFLVGIGLLLVQQILLVVLALEKVTAIG